MAVILVRPEYITLKSGKDIRLDEVKFNSQTLFFAIDAKAYVQWQWQWQWQWNIHCQNYTDSGINHTRSWRIINDNIRRQARWYHNFGGSKYVCAPSSCIEYDSYICGEQENRVQGARKSEYSLENCKNTYSKTRFRKIIKQTREDNNDENKNKIRIDIAIKYGKRSRQSFNIFLFKNNFRQKWFKLSKELSYKSWPYVQMSYYYDLMWALQPLKSPNIGCLFNSF